MSITIELPAEIEESLSALAEERGVPLQVYLSHLLIEKISSKEQQSPAQRAQMWRDAAKGLPDSLPLSDEAVSREGVYGSRG